MRVAAVAFDIDQTLWDFHAVRVEALRAVGRFFEEHTTLAPAVAAPLLTVDSLQERYDRLERANAASRLGEIRAMALDEAAAELAPDVDGLGTSATDLYFSIRYAPGAPYPDVVPALTELQRAGIRLAVVSNGNTDLDAMGIEHFFDEIVLGPRVGTAKPHEDIYRLVEARLGLGPDRLVCVGDDQEKDVTAPQRFGWRGVWNRRDGEELAAGCAPDATVSLLTELPQIVAGWR